MIYEMEALAKTLKQARERKQLSQRELSKRTGVPQSHISKIEKAGVDLRVSSLNTLANALDLELALVPKKAVPAVKSISRGAISSPVVPAGTAKVMTRISNQIDAIGKLDIDRGAYEELQRNFRALKHIQALIPDIMQLNHISQLMKDIDRNAGVGAITNAAREMARVHNNLVDPQSGFPEMEHPRPRYHLDGDDNG